MRIYAYDPVGDIHRLLAVHREAKLSRLSDFLMVSQDGYLYYTIGQPGLFRVSRDGSDTAEMLAEGEFYAASETHAFGIEWETEGRQRSLYSYDLKTGVKKTLLVYGINDVLTRQWEEMKSASLSLYAGAGGQLS